MMQWHVSNQEWEPTAFQKKKKRTEQGTTFQHHFMRTVLTNQQVHMTDQVVLPALWNSFVGTGIHNGPVPPAKQAQVLLLLRRSTHTPDPRTEQQQQQQQQPQPPKEGIQ